MLGVQEANKKRDLVDEPTNENPYKYGNDKRKRKTSESEKKQMRKVTLKEETPLTEKAEGAG